MTDLKVRIIELEYENSTLRRDFNKVLELNSELRTIIKKQDTKIENLTSDVCNLKKELEKHKVKPNEPSGSKAFFEKKLSQKPHKKSGQKKGHKGTSRKSPTKIHKILDYIPNCCESCNSINLKNIKIRNKIISDLEFKVINSKENYHDMLCLDCGFETKPVSVHGTSKSPFGRTTQTLIAYLRSVCGDTLRPIENLFRDFFNLEISDSSISNNEIRLSKETLDEYNHYLKLVKSSSFSHKDETSYRVNGKNYWIWVYDSIKYVFYRMANSRGKKVVLEDFGHSNKQISINDCYGAYNDFENQQICFAHIMRESEAHAEKEGASREENNFFKGLKKLYSRACNFVLNNPSINLRKIEKYNLESELTNLMLSLNKKSDFLRKMCNRLNKRLNHCFLFVEVPGLPATNNQAERSLRPFVVHRKISFGSKSEDGALAKVVFKTMYENAKRSSINLIDSLNHIFESNSKITIFTT